MKASVTSIAHGAERIELEAGYRVQGIGYRGKRDPLHSVGVQNPSSYRFSLSSKISSIFSAPCTSYPAPVFHSSRGFTLIEVLIATIILAFGLLFIAESLSMAEREHRAANALILGVMTAENHAVDQAIRVRQFAKLGGGQDQGSDTFPNQKIDWVVRAKPFRHKTILDETKLNEISVELNWNEGSSRRSGLNVSTLLMNREKKQDGQAS